MRLLKLLLTAILAIIAVMGGLLTAFVITVMSLSVILTRKLLRRGPAPAPPPLRTRPRPKPTGDVIEVSATEVPDRRLPH